MAIQNVDNTNTKASGILLNSLAGGVIASEIHKALLPAETKAALKNTTCGVDNFVKNAQKAAQKTMKKTGKTFNLDNIAEKAKNMYPEMKETAANASKKLGKTFAVTAIGIAAGSFIGRMIAKSKGQEAQAVDIVKNADGV